jgi:hypothetical protein
MRRQGLGTGGWGLGICLGLSLVTTWGSLGLSKEPQAGLDEARVRVTVRVYNYAHLSTRTLNSARKEAAAIFAKAGIESEWRVCSSAEDPIPAACNQPLRPGEVALRIVRRPKPQKGALGCTECGTAVEDAGGTGIYATLFYDCLNLMPKAEGLSPSFVLGNLLAHEIGHLLLPGKDHSPQGIMRPQMRDKDWRLAAVGALVFTPNQADRIRKEVLRRTGSERAEATVAVGSQR